MILIGGSFVVSDVWEYGDPKDLDVIYLTWNPGIYVLLVRYKGQLGELLSEDMGIEVSFSPFLLFSPKLIGNLFLASVLSRTSFNSFLSKLTKIYTPKRWLLLHLIYAFLGLYSAKNLRGCIKYGAMFAENLILSRKRSRLPRSWLKTIVLGYAVAQELDLPAHSSLFLALIKYIKKRLVDLGAMRRLAVEAFTEGLSSLKVEVSELDRALTRLGILDEPLRALHEAVCGLASKKAIRWRRSVKMLVSVARYAVVAGERAKPDAISKIFSLCKLQVPVLSPLAHP